MATASGAIARSRALGSIASGSTWRLATGDPQTSRIAVWIELCFVDVPSKFLGTKESKTLVYYRTR